MQKISEIVFFEKINTLHTSVSQLTKKEREIQTNKLEMKNKML